MGMMSLGHWFLVLAVVIMLFGTRKLGTLGNDLGTAIKGFRRAMSEEKPADQ